MRRSSCTLPILLALAGRALADDGISGTDIPIVELILHYIPSRSIAIIAGVLYFVAAVLLGYHVRVWKDRWALCLPIGAACMALGYFVRFAETFGSLLDNLWVYIVMDLFILCAPATFLAFNYILYGRVIMQCVGREHSILPPERVARIFVISDVTTFSLQSTGGSLAANYKIPILVKVGNAIVLLGLILQALSYIFFLYVAFRAHRSVMRTNPHKEPWWTVLWALYFSSIFIVIRCIYRVVEFAQGSDGYLVTHEVYFYCLDALPLLIAISVYIPFWPSKYLSRASADYMIPLGSIASM